MIQSPVISAVQSRDARRRPQDRRGATLVEVLMALLVMAIGVTSIFTLFPLSILRSIKASQLTNSKLVFENAREVILANPQLVTGAPPWQPNLTVGTRPAYTPIGSGGTPSNCWLTPTPRAGRLLPDTNLLYLTPNQAGTTGRFEPKWRNGVVDWTGAQISSNRGGYRNVLSGYITTPPFPFSIHDGTLNDSSTNRAWFAYRHSRYEPDPRWSAYVVDPLGWHEMDGQGNVAERDRLGALDRIHCQLTLAQAQELFASPDTWQQVLATTTPTLVSFPAAGEVLLEFEPQVDLSGSRSSGRVVILSDDGRRSLALDIDVPNSGVLPNNQIQVDGTLPADLDQIIPGEIGSVRIETYEQRYSWLMTVHLGPRGQAQIDGVIFHNRSFNPDDEAPVAAEFHGPAAGGYNLTQAMITWPAGRSGGNPPVKEGSYIYDSNNAHWYRIQKIESIDNTSATRTATLTLNTSVTVPTSQEVAPNYDGRAILFPNIISVFHLDLE